MPDDSQLASRLGIDRETLWRWQHDGEAAHAMSLEHAHSDSESGDFAERVFEASGRSDVDDTLTHEQELVALQTAIRALGSRERTVLALYYYEELRLHQIAEVLGVTESRVSQIRTRAIARLREQLVTLRGVTANVPARS
jgi:RNA polymerase sigma factor for flagellar operon FliA